MVWQIRLRNNEGDVAQPFLSPDLVITQAYGASIHFDHQLSLPRETNNKLGLSSIQSLHTAVIIQLFTDRRIRPEMDHVDPFSPDPRGWWGDTVSIDYDASETELGSHLWTLRRSVLNQDVVDTAGDYAREALQPIVEQGAVAYFDVTAEAQKLRYPNGAAADMLAIGVDGYSHRGLSSYSQKFDVLWDQVRQLITA